MEIVHYLLVIYIDVILSNKNNKKNYITLIIACKKS